RVALCCIAELHSAERANSLRLYQHATLRRLQICDTAEYNSALPSCCRTECLRAELGTALNCRTPQMLRESHRFEWSTDSSRRRASFLKSTLPPAGVPLFVGSRPARWTKLNSD